MLRGLINLPVIQDFLHFTDSNHGLSERAVRSASSHVFTTKELEYIPFCDDFGPMNLSEVFRFSDILKNLTYQYPNKILVYSTDTCPRQITNAVFLLGSYLILDRDKSPEDAWQIFESISGSMEMYRDATYSNPTFRLSLQDCWSGLHRAKAIGWIQKIDLEGEPCQLRRKNSCLIDTLSSLSLV